MAGGGDRRSARPFARLPLIGYSAAARTVPADARMEDSMSVFRPLALLAALVVGACDDGEVVEKSTASEPTADLKGGLPPLDTERPGSDTADVGA